MESVPFHIGIVTDDIGASQKALGTALGVTWTSPTTTDEVYQSVDGTPQPRPISCISREGPIHIDLIKGKPDTLWESNRPRLHHFAYWTDDLPGDVELLALEGWRLEMATPNEDGQPAICAYLVRADGLRLELLDVINRSDYTDRLK